MTIERRVPAHTPNEVRNEIAQILVSNMTGPTQIRKVYDYRTLPNLNSVEASISWFGGNSLQSPLLGNPYYNFILDIRVKHDNTQDGLSSAETALTEIIRDVWELLVTTQATTYRDIFPYQEDQAPGAPTEVTNIRRGYLFIRVTPI